MLLCFKAIPYMHVCTVCNMHAPSPYYALFNINMHISVCATLTVTGSNMMSDQYEYKYNDVNVRSASGSDNKVKRYYLLCLSLSRLHSCPRLSSILFQTTSNFSVLHQQARHWPNRTTFKSASSLTGSEGQPLAPFGVHRTSTS